MDNQEIKNMVSIITPTFNRARLLSRAIQSVLIQTIKDWELIIIDDGSTDNTEELVEKFKKKDNRIKFIKFEKNRGTNFARNIGLREAKGEYIAFLDTDDEWLSEKLEKQLEVFKNGGENLGLVYTGATFINESTGERRIKRAKIKGRIFLQELACNPIGGSSRVMIKRKCLEKSGNFDGKFLSLEDWDLWTRISQFFEVDLVNLPLINYYESSDSISINADNLISGYQNFYLKYDIGNREKWIQLIFFLRLGHRLCYYGNMKVGRSYLLKAFKIRPTDPRNLLLLLSFFGLKIYRKITFFLMKI